MSIDVPKGVRVFSPEESYLLSNIENSILQTFKSWGYEEIKTPYFEYYDVHKKGVGENIANKTFRIIDRYNGETLTLRADFTAQIARYFASLKNKNLPYRVCYLGSIFRYEVPKGENVWEIRQSGIEFIGLNSIEADVEVLLLAIDALKNLSIEDFQIDLSSVSILYDIKEILNLSDEEFASFVNFVKNKEIFNLEKFVYNKNLDKTLKTFIIELPLYQGKKDLIENLKNKLINYKQLFYTLDYLQKIYERLDTFGFSRYINFDLSEIRQFDYYTGIIFEIFIPKYKKLIGQGGRYDKLIGKFDGNFPAVGFAFDITAIFDFIKKVNKLPLNEKILAVNLGVDSKVFFETVSILRKKGKKITLELKNINDLNEVLEYAFKKGFNKVFVFGVDKDTTNIYIYTRKDNYTVQKIEDLI